jgi:hypothetical protein
MVCRIYTGKISSTVFTPQYMLLPTALCKIFSEGCISAMTMSYGFAGEVIRRVCVALGVNALQADPMEKRLILQMVDWWAYLYGPLSCSSIGNSIES